MFCLFVGYVECVEFEDFDSVCSRLVFQVFLLLFLIILCGFVVQELWTKTLCIFSELVCVAERSSMAMKRRGDWNKERY